VLYLGCSSGTTVSHVSDIVGDDGLIFAVDLSPIVLRKMIFVSEKRKNIAPILESASHIDALSKRVCAVDILFQDVAQRDQVAIFTKNAQTFLKEKGFGFLAVKARSIDVAARPREIFKQVRQVLEKSFTVIDARELDPFQKDHCMFVIKK
jgi:fibrillarin-like pre-rRNA processing protein